MSNIYTSIEDNIDLIKKQMSQLDQGLSLVDNPKENVLYLVDNPKENVLYLKGFYDATRQFMQTFDKWLDLQMLDKH